MVWLTALFFLLQVSAQFRGDCRAHARYGSWLVCTVCLSAGLPQAVRLFVVSDGDRRDLVPPCAGDAVKLGLEKRKGIYIYPAAAKRVKSKLENAVREQGSQRSGGAAGQAKPRELASPYLFDSCAPAAVVVSPWRVCWQKKSLGGGGHSQLATTPPCGLPFLRRFEASTSLGRVLLKTKGPRWLARLLTPSPVEGEARRRALRDLPLPSQMVVRSPRRMCRPAPPRGHDVAAHT